MLHVCIVCEYDHFINGAERLRGMKDASHLLLFGNGYVCHYFIKL